MNNNKENSVQDDFKSILEKSKSMDNDIFDTIYNNLLNNNYKFKNIRKWNVSMIYIYSIPTSVKSVNESDIQVETSWTIESKFYSFLFRYASAYSNTKDWKVSYIKKIPVYKESWNFKKKSWNYATDQLLQDNIIFSAEKIWFKEIKKNKTSEWNITVYILEKKLIKEQKNKLKPFIYTIMNMKSLVEEYWKDTINDFLLILVSYFIIKD